MKYLVRRDNLKIHAWHCEGGFTEDLDNAQRWDTRREAECAHHGNVTDRIITEADAREETA